MNEELLQYLKEIQLEWGRGTVKAIIKKIDRERLVFEGNLRRSIDFDLNDKGEFVFDMEGYGAYLDEGVNGTVQNRGSKFQFAGNYKGTAYALTAWATSKGLNRFAVARSIQKKGIKPRRFFNDVIASRTNDLGELITQGMADWMENNIGDKQ